MLRFVLSALTSCNLGSVVMTPPLAQSIDSGLRVKVRVLDKNSAIVARCEIVYDLWDEVYVVDAGNVRHKFPGRAAAVQACAPANAPPGLVADEDVPPPIALPPVPMIF